MANSTREPKNTEENRLSSTVKPNPNSGSNSNTFAPKNKSFMTAGAMLIACGALATSIYTISQNQHIQNQLKDKNNLLSAQIDTVAQKQEKVQEQIETKTNTIEETRSSLQAKFDALNNQLQTAMSQKFYQNQNWQLLKARYYLELAQINAHWSKNFDSTVALLQQADQLLQQVHDPKIFAIRQAIAKDIAQIQALPKIDLAGILSQLDATQTSLNDLSILAVINDEKTKAEEQLDSSKKALPVWRLRLQDSMQVLSKLVVIRRNDEQIKPLISPAYEAIVKENICLNLQEAQWAVLNGNPEVYKLVLTQAITTLKKNFNQHAQNTMALINKLNELQQIQITQKRPEIGTALPLLNQLIASQESSTKHSSTINQGGNAQ
ncbi:MAG: uroporphyrinogen-III C-methyltransferase [Legionella sp.]|uniref:uroporphyrinogen-III C-methyltransferase n=1 Tax=Legionella sp. TaxID=459 RepID=UPI0039E4F561